MRSKKALANFLASISYELVVAVCGFILPRLIIAHFGSPVNGLVGTITNYLGFISLIEAGVGGVVRASLYGPLAKGDSSEISRVVRASNVFFRRIGWIFAGYVFVVGGVLPLILKTDLDFWYIFTLTIIIGSATFVNYYFGISNTLLLAADQRNYIQLSLRIVTTLLNTIVGVILIQQGAGIHAIKLFSSLVFIARPLLLHWYCRRRYGLNPHIELAGDPIRQKWDGLGHHISNLIHTKTDIVLLSLFADLSLQSVYTVHLTVIKAVSNLVISLQTGSQAAFGNIIAKGEETALQRNFRSFELLTNLAVGVLFTCTALLITPFISVYMRNITDVSYYRPVFAYLIVAAEAVYYLRIPYNTIILAAGHYRQTKISGYIEAGINIVLSLILIQPLGLSGVAIGTLAAMIYRTLYCVHYVTRNILHYSWARYCKRIGVDALAIVPVAWIYFRFLDTPVTDYRQWFLLAIKTFAVAAVLNLAVNLPFYRGDFGGLFKLVKNILTRSGRKKKASN